MMNDLINLFKLKYGIGNEIKIPNPILTIKDNYPSTHCSGNNGYITKLRINKETMKLEYYHDWWDYGWFSDNYKSKVKSALKQLL